jgi:cell division septation protein DedD
MADLLGLITGGLTAATNIGNARDEGMAARRKEARDDLLARIEQERQDADASVRRDYMAAQTRTMNAPRAPRTQVVDGMLVNLDDATSRPIQGMPQVGGQGAPQGTPAKPYEERNEGGGVAIYENGRFKSWKIRPPVERATAPAAAGAPVTMSEGERKTGALLQTAQVGYDTLESLLAENGGTPPTLMQRAASSVGLGVGNVLSPQQLRQMDQAGYSLAEAWLRLTSGGAITPDEITNVKNTILPQPGDDPQTMAQKAQLRATYIRAIRTAAGRGAVGIEGPNTPTGNQVQTSTGRTFTRPQ